MADAGDEFVVAPDERTAKSVAEAREHWHQRSRSRGATPRVSRGVKLEDIFEQIQPGEVATLNILLKADTTGSLEALTESLRKLERDEVSLAFVHRAVGGITQQDVSWPPPPTPRSSASTSAPTARPASWRRSKRWRSGTTRSSTRCSRTSRTPWSACSRPSSKRWSPARPRSARSSPCPAWGNRRLHGARGIITRGSKVRFLRDGTIIWKGAVSSLRRFKDDVREVRAGFECGIGLTDFQDLKQGDIIETFEEREIPAVSASDARVGLRSVAWRAMFVLALEVDLHIAEARSLKDKRSVVKSLVEGAKKRYGVAAAEVGYQQQWQRVLLGFAVVAPSEGHAREVMDEVDRFVWSHPEVQVLATERRWLE